METKTNHTFRNLMVVLAVVAVTGLAMWAGKQGRFFLASVTVSSPYCNASPDPLKSTVPCNDEGEASLTVTGAGGGPYDWYVEPVNGQTYNVLRDPTSNQLVDEILGEATGSVKVGLPSSDEPLPSPLTVRVVPQGGFSAQSFAVNVVPACVDSLEFLTPSGVVRPVEGEVTIEKIRARLSNGCTYEYDQNEIPSLDLDFVTKLADDSEQPAGPVVTLPNEHGDTRIVMRATGANIRPTHVNAALIEPVSGSNVLYMLESAYAEPGTLIVKDGGTFLAPGTDYDFENSTDPATAMDAIRLRADLGMQKTLTVTYSYRNPDAAPVEASLMILATTCHNLHASILLGEGQGLYIGDTANLPIGSESVPFDFDGVTPLSSIILGYNPQVSPGYGKRTFTIRLQFVAGLRDRAVLDSSMNGTYEIRVRDEGDDKAATASNFAYVFNSDLLKTDSPFTAYPNPEDATQIVLQSRGLAAHTNHYTCLTNVGVVNPCFIGGADSADPTVGNVVSQPLTQNNTLTQGDTALVYARGGIGEITWRSLSPALLKVESLAETSQTDEPGNVTFVPTPIIGTPNMPLVPMLENVKCEDKDMGENNPPDRVCTFDVSVNVVYPAQGTQAGYMAKVIIGAETYNVYLSSSEISGKLSVTGLTYSKLNGFAGDTLTGKLNGYMSGVVSGGEAVGGVDGRAESDASVQLESIPGGKLTVAAGDLSLSSVVPSGNLTPMGGGFASTIRIQDIDVTTYAKLTAMCPSPLTSPVHLILTDSAGCVADLPITVQPRRLTVKMVDKDPSDIFEVGDTIRLQATFQGDDVTTQVTWGTSDNKVATVDATGLVHIVGSGEANITASYDHVGDTACVTGSTSAALEPPLPIHVNQLSDITLSLDAASVGKLSKADKDAAYKQVAVILHSPLAKGSVITVEGVQIPVVLPAEDPANPYKTNMDKIKAMVNDPASGLQNNLAVSKDINGVLRQLITVETMEAAGYPGILLLTPTADNENGIVDISTTANAADLTLVPQLGLLTQVNPEGIHLPATETFRMIAIGRYDNGRTKVVSPRLIKWDDSPYVLDKDSLDNALLKRGDKSGTSQVIAQIEGTTPPVMDNLYVTVPSGPVIEWIHRDGTGVIKKNTLLKYKVKITDVDTVADLSKITVSLVKSAEVTPEFIANDPNAKWFITDQDVPFNFEQAVAEPSSDEGEEGIGSGTEDTDGAGNENPPAAESQELPYKIYDVSFTVPNRSDLSDGNYKVIFTAYDTAGNTTAYVLPIYIGALGTGDVFKDSRLNRADVFMTLLIANGRPIPAAFTAKVDRRAADMNGDGTVTMMDVILLFQAVRTAG